MLDSSRFHTISHPSLASGEIFGKFKHLTPSALASGEIADMDHNETEGSLEQSSGNSEKYLTEARFVSTMQNSLLNADKTYRYG